MFGEVLLSASLSQTAKSKQPILRKIELDEIYFGGVSKVEFAVNMADLLLIIPVLAFSIMVDMSIIYEIIDDACNHRGKA